MHIHAGPTSLCVLSSLSFLCVCALGALYVRLSLLFHNNTKQPAQQQTNVIIK